MTITTVTILAAAALAQSGAGTATEHTFGYSDIAAFERAIERIDEGTPAAEAFELYVEEASLAFHAFAQRYDATPESIANAYDARPNYYRSLPDLVGMLELREAELSTALTRLADMAPVAQSVPVHFLVGNQTAGGTPVLVQGGERPSIAIAVAIDMIGLRPGTDMAEFPSGTGGRANAEDLPQVVVHENAHVLQMRAQGGIENYLSIYQPDHGTMLTIAVREGCAEYLTYLASGWRLGDRHLFGAEHEAALWAEFEAVMSDPPFSHAGWFGGTHPEHAGWPAQIGYWVGSRICETHHRTAADPDAALAELFAVYEHDALLEWAETYSLSLSETD